MRRFSVCLGISTSVAFGAALLAAGCSDNFDGCAATRSCPPSHAGSSGSSGSGGAGTAGTGGAKAAGGAGGSQSGKGGTESRGVAGDEPGGDSGGDACRGGEPEGRGGSTWLSSGDAAGGRSGNPVQGGMGGVAEGGAGGAEPDPEDDLTPPTIISISPEDGAKGVPSDSPIVITFSEPMDHVSTEAAYESATLPAGRVTFDWNDDSTVLTVLPIDGLQYASGTTPSSPAKVYSIAISSTAEDRAGNQLEDVAWSFATLRTIAQRLPITTTSGCEDDRLRATCAGAESCYGIEVSFSLSTVPSGIIEWQGATCSGAVIETGREAPAGHDAQFMLAHLIQDGSEFLTNELGLFSTAVGTFEREVGDVVFDDYTHRSERQNLARFRFGPEIGPPRYFDEAAYSEFSCSGFGLTVKYLVP